MAGPAPHRIRSLYRSLLRELPPRPILRQPRSPVHSHIRDSFSSSGDSAATAVAAHSNADAARAEQLAAYLRSQRSYVTLLERYNPGMGMDEEERIRLSARRVGMNMPEEYATKKD